MQTKRFNTLFKKWVQFHVYKNNIKQKFWDSCAPLYLSLFKIYLDFMIILKELNLHQKSVNKALDMVLILFTKFDPNFTFRRCSYGTNILIM
jgi:hypothetical protein